MKTYTELLSIVLLGSEEDYKRFKEVLDEGLFFPGGRTMSNAGIGMKLTLNNCFVAPQIQDNMEDIFDKVKLGALTHQKGGGIGYDFSGLRPRGTPTTNDAIASGAVSFMEVFDTQTRNDYSTEDVVELIWVF